MQALSIALLEEYERQSERQHGREGRRHKRLTLSFPHLSREFDVPFIANITEYTVKQTFVERELTSSSLNQETLWLPVRAKWSFWLIGILPLKASGALCARLHVYIHLGGFGRTPREQALLREGMHVCVRMCAEWGFAHIKPLKQVQCWIIDNS